VHGTHTHAGWSIHRPPPITASKPWLLILFVVLLLTVLTVVGSALMYLHLAMS